jgi:glutathione S-transferase
MPDSGTDSIVLYGSTQSGHSYKPRLYMLLAGIEHDYHHIDIFTPHGEPVLVHNGQIVAQSNAILLHLMRHFGKFSGSSEAQLDEITSWLFWEANRIGRSYPNHRYFHKFATCDAGLLNWFDQTARADLDRLNDELTEKEFLLGEFTAADISCAAYLLYDDNPAIKISEWSNVQHWLNRIKALSGWKYPVEALA